VLFTLVKTLGQGPDRKKIQNETVLESQVFRRSLRTQCIIYSPIPVLQNLIIILQLRLGEEKIILLRLPLQSFDLSRMEQTLNNQYTVLYAACKLL
jgi:hypothetical protein